MARRHARRAGNRRPRPRARVDRHGSSTKRSAAARTCRSDSKRPTSTRYRSTLQPSMPGDRELEGAPAPLRALERAGDGLARQQGQFGTRRTRRELRVGGDAVRRRLQSLLSRPVGYVRRRSRLLTRPLGAGLLRARVSRRTHLARTARTLSPRSRRERPLVVSASLADAGLLAVSDGLDGPGTDHVDLPGALHALPARSRVDRRARSQGVGVPRRRRDGRTRIARRDLAGRARKTRQSHLGHQLQPAAARRPGARQRQDHSRARARLQRRRLERHQGDLGQQLGSAAAAPIPADGSSS